MGNCLNVPLYKKGADWDWDLLKNVLESHNACRRKHKLPHLTIDEELCNQAFKGAAKLLRNRSTLASIRAKKDNIGTNVFLGKFATGSDVVQQWYDEIRYFDFGLSDGNGMSENLSQLLWAKSERIGIGYATLKERGYCKDVLVCKYYPAGNVRGLYHLNVMPIPKEVYLDISSDETADESGDTSFSKDAFEEFKRGKMHKVKETEKMSFETLNKQKEQFSVELKTSQPISRQPSATQLPPRKVTPRRSLRFKNIDVDEYMLTRNKQMSPRIALLADKFEEDETVKKARSKTSNISANSHQRPFYEQFFGQAPIYQGDFNEVPNVNISSFGDSIENGTVEEIPLEPLPESLKAKMEAFLQFLPDNCRDNGGGDTMTSEV